MKLTESQKYAFKELSKFCVNDEKEIILTGSPGYGKSFLINELSKEYDIVLTATTNKAAVVVGGVTIHSLLGLRVNSNDESGEVELDFRSIRVVRNMTVVIDECSMINRELYDVIRKYMIDCKIIYVGDYYQLPPVNDSFSIFNLGIKMLELKEPCRTDKFDIIRLCYLLKHAITEGKRFVGYEQSENIKFIRSEDELHEKLMKFDEQKDKILTFTNDDVLLLNSKMRQYHGKSPLFTDGDLVVCKSVIKSFYSPKMEEIKKIKSIITRTNTVSRVKMTDGCIYDVYLDQASYRRDVSSLYKEARETQSWKKYSAFRRSVLDIRDVYAGTVHSSQGSTYNNVYINIKNIYDYNRSDIDTLMRLMYVAVSRAKEKVYLFKG